MAIQWYNAQTGSAPIVSIANYGITFSSGAVEILSAPKYVMFGFEEDTKSIVISPCLEATESSLEFINKKRNGYVRISNKDFMRFIESKMENNFKITKNAIKYLAKWKKDEKLLYIYLDNPIDKDKDNNES
jgi:hypothetical protein